SSDLFAVLQFMRRRVKAGRSFLRVFLFGDTDEGARVEQKDEFAGGPGKVLGEMLQGGVHLPWTLGLAALIGVWLMFTRVTLGAEGGMANADHVIGALVLTVVSVAAAEVARVARFLLIPLGMALIATPFLYEASDLHMATSVGAGIALIGLCLPRGQIRGRYGLKSG